MIAPNPTLTDDRTMRAVRITAPRRAEVAEVASPEPLPTQVRVRLEGCGICGSNLALWQGRRWFRYPLDPGAPGHEGWGTVDSVGGDVRGVRPGERVALLSYHAYAEYDVAEASALVPLPSGTAVFPGEALGCAVNVFRRSEIHSGQAVAVIGIGFIGALLVQLAARSRATVIAISRRQYALDIARKCGAAEAIPLANVKETAARIMNFTEQHGCARVIEAAGEQDTLDLAGEVIAVRGRLVIAGYHQDGPRSVDLQLWNWRGIDVINAHEREPQRSLEGISAAATAITNGELDPSLLYTHAFPLDQIGDAFTALEQRPSGFLKAWIRTSI